jgi:hypothetical protein
MYNKPNELGVQMSKRPVFVKSVEAWNVKSTSTPGQRVVITKLAVRAPNGQFHGATNFRQTGKL